MTQTTPNDSLICLEQKKVNFYVEYYLRYKSLKEDTTIMGMEIRGCDAIIEVKDRQISNLGDVSKLKDTIITKTRTALTTTAKKLEKSEKKVKRRGNIIGIAVSADILLIILLVLSFLI